MRERQIQTERDMERKGKRGRQRETERQRESRIGSKFYLQSNRVIKINTNIF